MPTNAKIIPFLPGHFETFDLKTTGKVELLECSSGRFHCCTQEPAPSLYDSAEVVSGRPPRTSPPSPPPRPLAGPPKTPQTPSFGRPS